MPRILERTFWQKFKPVKNHLDTNASFDGHMFETYGPELEHVQSKVPEGTVWTLLDCDGQLVISSGFSFVNRMGYFITEKPAPAEAYFQT